ncbi:MAG TPA: NAD(P)-dependent oxidoreductase [bacterium]|nr:NAD(P)-dependent oxidoreductase [bacterium]
MKKILITGINGFIGKNLVNVLKDNYYIIGLDLHQECKFQIKKYYQIDITDKEKVLDINEEIDFVIHLVALTDPNLERKKIYNVNVIGTKNICELSKKNNVKKIIYLSTVSVYPDSKIKKITEETKEKPINYYGETKLEAEKIIKQSGINWVILRPTNIFGVERDDYKRYFARIKERGKKFGIIFYRNRITHLVYVKDVVEVIKLCLENSKTDNEIFIIADDEKKYSEKEVFKILLDFYKLRKKLLPFPIFWIKSDKRIFCNEKIKKIYNFKYGVKFGIKEVLNI